MDISYIINQLGEERENYFNAVSPPIIQTSNFAFENIDAMRNGIANEHKVSCYTRGMNPTVDILREKISALEESEDALVLSSGCAAICSAVLSEVKAGDHVVCVENPYSWTYKLMNWFLPKFGVETTLIDGKDSENFKNAVKPNTKLFFLESPNSISFELQNIKEITSLAKKRNIVTVIDNSYSTPLNQKPLKMGCDIVVYSASKYFGGHSDIVAGIICSSKERIHNIFKNEFMMLGGIISPNDAWLMIRGIRTLPLRLERISDTTEKIIKYFENNPHIKKINYPFYDKSEQYSLAKQQMKRATGLFSVEIDSDSIERVEIFCNNLKRFLLAVSWGGYESLVLPACIFYNKENPSPVSKISFNLVRFSIGLEDPEVLIEDFEQAFKKAFG